MSASPFSSGYSIPNTVMDGLFVCIGGGSNTVTGVTVAQAAQTLTMTARSTNYGYIDLVTGLVTVNTTGFANGVIPLFIAVADTFQVTSINDVRVTYAFPSPSAGGTTINATNNVIPKRANATSFTDSALTDDGTTVTSTEAIIATGTPVSSTFNAVTASSMLSSYANALGTSGIIDGVTAGLNVNPSGASSASTIAFFGSVSTPVTNAQNISSRVSGMLLNTFHKGSGNLTKATRSLIGIDTDTELTGSGTVVSLEGIRSLVVNASSGSGVSAAVSAFRGTSGTGANGGTPTTTNDYVFFAEQPTKNAGYTMTHHFGFYAANGQTGGTGNPDGWAFYVAGTTGGDRSQFGPIYYLTQTLPNFPAGGSIGTAALTVDISPSINITQTTAGQTLTLPSPTLATAGTAVYINNNGSQSFTMLGATVAVNQSLIAIWNGAVWSPTR